MGVYKYWVLANPTGYTVGFDIYYRTSGSDESSGKGLGYDVVKRLITHPSFSRISNLLLQFLFKLHSFRGSPEY